jgi:Calcineurin-like phosphoesterase
LLSRRGLFRTLGLGLGAWAGGRIAVPLPAAAQRALRLQSAPVPPLTQILGRPTKNSVALNVLSQQGLEAYVEFGDAPGEYSAQTPVTKVAAGQPAAIDIVGLRSDAPAYYRLRTRAEGATAFDEGAEYSFRTARSAGSAFSFTLQGDSHPERLHKMFDPDLYAQTMRLVSAERPDFHVTIGDDFSLDPLITSDTLTQEAVDGIYRNQRTFLGEVGKAASIFLMNGNHEQVEPFRPDGSPNPSQLLAGSARLRFFALPAPGDFYSGDAQPAPTIGPPRDYYAWTWGDALFVVFDPYWHSPVPVDPDSGNGHALGPRQRDWWHMSIGDAQYRWLKATLEGSNAPYKFVFGHHVMGTGRGGIEMADLYEWGGHSPNGQWEFDTYRPNWEMPIHQLLVKTGVSVFFFGHDHLFVRQEKDGVVYQETPMPADPTYTAFNADAYQSGDLLPNSGYIRVSVSPANARVEYVRSVLAKDETADHNTGMVAFAYDVKPRSGG